uniref:SHR-BD domain-containing protein n=1 Tax=Mesocestoides corti TaxID=53468 RepID=A0A5K3FV55_MESCO
RKPEEDADCIALSVEVQLTDAKGVNDGSRHAVVVKSKVNNKLILIDRVVVVARVPLDSFLHVNLKLVGHPTVNVGEYVVDVQANLSRQSTLECHKASFWLLHGGAFTVNVVPADPNDDGLILVPVSNGRGVRMLEFPQGGIYFGVSTVIRLVLRPLPSVKVTKNVNIDLSGMLRCHTYSQKPNNHEPIHRPPIYFSQTVRLVAAAGISGKTQTSGCTDGQRAASEPTRSYIAETIS